MFQKILQIFKIAFGKGLPELPPRESWPVRFLLASEEAWALEAILKQFQENPQKVLREICPAGLSGMMLYRLWQQGLYFNKSWDENPRCVKIKELRIKNEELGISKAQSLEPGGEAAVNSEQLLVNSSEKPKAKSLEPNASNEESDVTRNSSVVNREEQDLGAERKVTDSLQDLGILAQIAKRSEDLRGNTLRSEQCTVHSKEQGESRGGAEPQGTAKTNCNLTTGKLSGSDLQGLSSAEPKKDLAPSTYHLAPERSESEAENLAPSTYHLAPEHSESEAENLTPSTYHLAPERSEELLTTHFSLLTKRIVPILERQRLRDLTLVAQRKLAMRELDQWVVDWNQAKFGDDKSKWVRPIVIKGGATSKLYYPDESLRLSTDIDVIMPKEMIVDFAEGDIRWEIHDCAEHYFGKFKIEVHQDFTRYRNTSFLHDTRTHIPLQGYSYLFTHNADEMRFLAIIHSAKHFGEMPFDLIDVAFSSYNDFRRLNEAFILTKNGHVWCTYSVLLSELGVVEKPEHRFDSRDQKYSKLLNLVIFNPNFNQVDSSFLIHSIIRRQNYFIWRLRFLLFDLYKAKQCMKTDNKTTLIFAHIFYVPFVRLKILLRKILSR